MVKKTERLYIAADDYLQRQSNLHFHTRGVKDSRGKWWPQPMEVLKCCKEMNISRLFKANMELFRHSKTLKHVALLHGIKVKELRDVVPKVKMLNLLAGIDYEETRKYRKEKYDLLKRQNVTPLHNTFALDTGGAVLTTSITTSNTTELI